MAFLGRPLDWFAVTAAPRSGSLPTTDRPIEAITSVAVWTSSGSSTSARAYSPPLNEAKP
jgi:hypothetical protein